MNLAQSVRRHCEAICQDLRFVTINHDALQSYASQLPTAKDLLAPLTPEAPPAHPDRTPDQLERQRLLVLSLDTINFGSGWHDVVAKRPGMSGARSMAAGLKEFEADHGPLSASVLRSLTAERCSQIFRQDPGDAQSQQLMAHFSDALAQLASLVSDHGSAGALVRQSGSSAVGLAETLAQVQTFADTGFFKRAQIAAADLAREGLADFSDLEKLTAFADNLVPHVLTQDRIITLELGLAADINNGVLLEPRSRPETELRASAVHVVELLAQLRPDLRAMDIDQALWERGGQPRYKKHPRPRCRSLYY